MDIVGAAHIDRYLLPGVAVIVFVSLLPLIVEIHRHRKAARARHTVVVEAEGQR